MAGPKGSGHGQRAEGKWVGGEGGGKEDEVGEGLREGDRLRPKASVSKTDGPAASWHLAPGIAALKWTSGMSWSRCIATDARASSAATLQTSMHIP